MTRRGCIAGSCRTVRGAKTWSSRLANISLAALAKIYDLDFREAHHALEDAFVTARLWQKQLAKLESMGVRSLADLLRIAKA